MRPQSLPDADASVVILVELHLLDSFAAADPTIDEAIARRGTRETAELGTHRARRCSRRLKGFEQFADAYEP